MAGAHIGGPGGTRGAYWLKVHRRAPQQVHRRLLAGGRTMSIWGSRNFAGLKIGGDERIPWELGMPRRVPISEHPINEPGDTR
jgi:hypothetical protein